MVGGWLATTWRCGAETRHRVTCIIVDQLWQLVESFASSVGVVASSELQGESSYLCLEMMPSVCSSVPPRHLREGRKEGTGEEAMGEFSKESCPSVKNILLLDSEGKRVAVKYFSDDWPNNASKLTFEKSVFTKTLKTNARAEAEITLFDGYIVVYKFIHDLHFFVTAGDDENELIIASVLQGFFDSVGLLLRGDVEKRTALENLDLILLCIDEIIDGGIILETDANTIAGKVATNAVDGSVPFSEQTISQALATAREHFARSLLK